MSILDQAWLEAGATPEEIEQEKQVDQLLQRLLADGASTKALLDDWQNKSAAEILEEYGEVTPAAAGEATVGSPPVPVAH
jgi:hypothetical protein